MIQFTLNRGGEFINGLLEKELKSLGIILHPTAGHSPEQNGVSERAMRIIITKAISMMLEAGGPLQFWFLACNNSVSLTNRILTSLKNMTMFEAWNFRKPSVQHLRFWGFQAFILIRKEK